MAKRLRLISILMVAGSLLLALGIGRWMQSEYASADMTLQRNIFEAFMKSRNRVSDSIIARNFIFPLLNDTSGFEILTVDTKAINTDGDSGTMVYQEIHTDTTVKISICDTCPTDFPIALQPADSNRALIRGVKLFFNEFKGPEAEKLFIKQHISSADTLLLQNTFYALLDSSNINVKVTWHQQDSALSMPPPEYQYDSRLFDPPYVAKVTDADTFILRSMVPQFLFAFLLTGVVAGAFFFSYRNLKRQMQLTQLKDDLISNISHELKTPVATVKVALEAMQEMQPAKEHPQMKQYLHMADQEVVRLDNLVNKVMQSVIADDQDFYQSNLIDLNALVHATLQGMSSTIAQQQVQVGMSAVDSKYFIMGDAFHLRSAIYNLLDNAIKYGGGTPHIHITLTQDEQTIKLAVADNGPGIPEAYREKVFEKFFRVPTGNKHNVKGYGLGLHYVKQVVQACNGFMYVQNNSTAGCTFTLQFPRADAEV